jgi:hypothetical protein
MLAHRRFAPRRAGSWRGMTTDPNNDAGRIPISGAAAWSYRPFGHTQTGDEEQIEVTAEREDGLTVTFAVPKYVSRGEDIHRVACVVIDARERMERSKGLGA